jgi:hypothetical protein
MMHERRATDFKPDATRGIAVCLRHFAPRIAGGYAAL